MSRSFTIVRLLTTPLGDRQKHGFVRGLEKIGQTVLQYEAIFERGYQNYV